MSEKMLSFRELAEKNDLSVERIRQILKQSLRKIHLHIIGSKKLRDAFDLSRNSRARSFSARLDGFSNGFKTGMRGVVEEVRREGSNLDKFLSSTAPIR